MKHKNATKRRIILISIMVLGLFITNWSELFLQRNQSSIGWGISRPFLFVLINVHVVVIIILLYQIIRQSIKLFSEQTHKQPGSTFTKNLFFAFALFSVIPSFFVFFSAGKFITTSIDDWFHARISSGLNSALALHEAQSTEQRLSLKQAGHQVVQYLDTAKNQQYHLATLHVELQKLISLQPEIQLYLWPANNKELTTSIKQEILVWRNYRQLNDRSTKMLKQAFLNKIKNDTEPIKLFDFYGSLYWTTKYHNFFIILIYRYPQEIRLPLIDIQNSLQDYLYLKSMRNPIYNSYMYTFFLLTILILFLSIWCAFYLSKGLSEPIKNLIRATENLKQGKWDTIVPSHPNSDLKLLEQGFNEMIKALEQAHYELAHKNKEMLTILENIKAAVFFINPWGRIITYNQAAKQLTHKYLNIDRFKNKRINVLGSPVKKVFLDLVKKLRRLENPFLSEEITFTFHNEQKTLMAHLTLINAKKNQHGLGKEKNILIVIEDLTELVKANKIKTWREAAQQMAHEIKNPLTPIQLATQRLQRKYKNSLPDGQIFMDCTSTILQQVTIVKNLISYFSEFASMPKVHLEDINIGTIIENTMRFYMVSYPAITFMYAAEKVIPPFQSDAKKIKRVLINLLDNSVRALQEKTFLKTKLIKILTSFDEANQQLSITVSDNGPGIDKTIKDKLFLPYVSSHKKNMGLGLAIVHEIISQLNGTIELLPTAQGATFKITFSLRPHQGGTSQR